MRYLNPSTEAAKAVCERWGLGEDQVQEVAKVIMAESHKAKERNERERYMKMCADATGYGPDFTHYPKRRGQ